MIRGAACSVSSGSSVAPLAEAVRRAAGADPSRSETSRNACSTTISLVLARLVASMTATLPAASASISATLVRRRERSSSLNASAWPRRRPRG
jgi:hypothetical protein